MAVYVWNRAPFLRLLPPMILGILLQWTIGFSLFYLAAGFIIFLLPFIFYFFLPLRLKFRLSFISGIMATVLVLFVGCIITWLQDVRNSKYRIDQSPENGFFIKGVIDEPLVEKLNTYRAVLKVSIQYNGTSVKNIAERIIIYFQKSPITKTLHYGSLIVFQRAVQMIQGSGNPGAFDYGRYCLFQGLTHQAYLGEKDFVVLPGEEKHFLPAFIYACRSRIVMLLRNFIRGNEEAGLAEALMIGYKEDLDAELVQSYSNTGVVHVIAISGLHLGLVYAIMMFLTRPLKRKNFRAVRLVLILLCLWLFSLLAGGQPSVLRSSVMFSFLAAGEASERKTNIYNNLALSAFVLLCINPFWLWDAGFQLSYLAVLSIVIFFRAVYNWFVIDNKFLDALWQLNAVTISAQLLTLPISLYHFHQVPLLFLFTNLVAVPLSSVILIGEIILCCFAFLPSLALLLGVVLKWMIWLMNAYIGMIEKIPFATWQGLSITELQTVFLTFFVMAFCTWLLEKQKGYLFLALACMLPFTILRTISFIDASHRRQLVVFNIPKSAAIDMVDGRRVYFAGDTGILRMPSLYHFHIQPSRIMDRINSSAVTGLKSFSFFGRHVCIIDSAFIPVLSRPKEYIDLLILSHNPKINMADLDQVSTIHQVVIDSSVPAWKAALLKTQCEKLHLNCYYVGEKGAFVLNL